MERKSNYLAYGLWALFWVILFIQTFYANLPSLVVQNYFNAAQAWLHTKPLYTGHDGGFVYLPFSAMVHTVFLPFPRWLAVALYRTLLILVLLCSVWLFCRQIKQTWQLPGFFWVSLITILLGFSTVSTGQLNVVLAAAFMITTVCLWQGRWCMCGLLLALVFGLKPTILPWALLVLVLFPRTGVAFVMGLLCVIGAPFLFQKIGYVISQYHLFWQNLQVMGHNSVIDIHRWSQIFNVISQMGWIMSYSLQRIIVVLAGLGTLGLAWLAKRTYSSDKAILLLFVLGVTYLMLFNLRNEGNDYVIIAPAYAAAMCLAWQQKRKTLSIFFGVLAIGVLGNYYFSQLLIPGQTCWFAPFVTLIFAVFFIPFLFLKWKA